MRLVNKTPQNSVVPNMALRDDAKLAKSATNPRRTIMKKPRAKKPKKIKVVKQSRVKTVVRMNVSVPIALREEMDKFQAEKYVNWSEIAANAFRNHMKKD